jgi:glycosyltransferase involved in cell wall biosynthesis
MTLPKVSIITCTFGRFSCVERVIKQIYDQDYTGEWEHIIYNTCVEHPLILDSSLIGKNIFVINNNVDFQTHAKYTNVGSIRRDSLLFATGDYCCIADDDDAYLKHYIRQGVDGMLRHPTTKAFKPKYSLFETDHKLEQAQNSLEASVIIDMPILRSIGYKEGNGDENLSWYTELGWSGRMVENDEYTIPSYVYRWVSNDGAKHRQSGNMGDPDNFVNHKLSENDYGDRALTLQKENSTQIYYDYFKSNIDGRTSTPDITPTFPVNWHPELIEKYVRQYL